MQNPQTLEVVVGLAKSEFRIDMQLSLHEMGDEVGEIGMVRVNVEKQQLVELMQLKGVEGSCSQNLSEFCTII